MSGVRIPNPVPYWLRATAGRKRSKWLVRLVVGLMIVGLAANVYVAVMMRWWWLLGLEMLGIPLGLYFYRENLPPRWRRRFPRTLGRPVPFETNPPLSAYPHAMGDVLDGVSRTGRWAPGPDLKESRKLAYRVDPDPAERALATATRGALRAAVRATRVGERIRATGGYQRRDGPDRVVVELEIEGPAVTDARADALAAVFDEAFRRAIEPGHAVERLR